MKEELYKQFIALIFGGVLGVIFKYWYDYKAMVLKSLWEERYRAYRGLVLITGVLPLYPVRANVSYADIYHASEKMRDWYFKEGGLLLSKKARDKYFDVQKKIRQVTNGRSNDEMLEPLMGDYETVRNYFSELRTELTNDLMSRRRLRGFFEWKNDEPKEETKKVEK